MTDQNPKKENHQSPQSQELKDVIMGKIESGEVKSRSKKSFFAEDIFFIIALLISLLGARFVINMFIYWGNAGGHMREIGLGKPGRLVFAHSFPTEWFIVAVILFVLAYVILKHFDISYKKPLGYVLSGLAVSALLIGIIISVTPLNRGIAGKVRQGRFTPIHGIYRPGRHLRDENSTVGTIKKIENNVITLDINGEDVAIN